MAGVPTLYTMSALMGTVNDDGELDISQSTPSLDYVYNGALVANTAALVSDLLAAKSIVFQGVMVGVPTASGTLSLYDAETTAAATSPFFQCDISVFNVKDYVLPIAINLQRGLVIKSNVAVNANAVTILASISI